MNFETLNLYFMTETFYSMLRIMGILAVVYPASYFLGQFLVRTEHENKPVHSLYSRINLLFLFLPLLFLLNAFHYNITPFLFDLIPGGMDWCRDYGNLFSGVVVLTVFSAWQQREFLLTAKHAIQPNTWENGKTSGIPKKEFFQHIALPIMRSNSIDNYKREFAATLKDTSLLGMIGVQELLSKTQQFASVNLEYGMHYIIAGCMYAVMVYIVLKICGLTLKDAIRTRQ